VGAAGLFVFRGMYWAAILFGMSALHAVRTLMSEGAVEELPQARTAPREAPVPGDILSKLAAARRALEDEDFDKATSLANEAVKLAGNHEVPLPRARVQAYEVLGWVAQLRGHVEEAGRWVKAAQQHGAPDPALVAAVMISRGETKDARKLLEQARASGDERKETVGPLIQILIADGEVARAAAVAFDIVESLSDDDARKMAEIAFGARANDWAARLYEAVFARTGAAEDAYEAARAHAADGANDRALDYLGRAVSAGFSDRARAWSDAALEPLRAGHKLETVVPRP
jgi:tetratricopeptide (TPR) repeat protein